MGTGRFLRSRNPGIELVAVQPSESFHGIEGLKHLPTAIVPPIYDESVPTRQLGIDTEEAYDVARRLARTEGLLVGPSTGASVAGALQAGAEAAASGTPAVIVAIAPDNGSKYLSTELWAGVAS
jgi:cysteine synthase B